jgi:chemotaxis protein CheX
MVGLTPLKGTPTAQIYPKTLYDVTAIVGLTGSVMGTVSVQLKTNMALKVTSNMLQMEVKTLNNDVSDAIGELGNMIAGGLKTDLEARGVKFDISIPTVIVGPGHSIGHLAGSESIFYPFFVNNEPFVIAVSVKI